MTKILGYMLCLQLVAGILQAEAQHELFTKQGIILSPMGQENSPKKPQEIPLIVEIADDDNERRQGLMYRKKLAENSGMLFIWEKPANITMWMKNTYIPLDMLFFHNNKLIGIIENTIPHSETILSIGKPSTMVLELPAGQARKYGLVEGAWVLHFQSE